MPKSQLPKSITQAAAAKRRAAETAAWIKKNREERRQAAASRATTQRLVAKATRALAAKKRKDALAKQARLDARILAEKQLTPEQRQFMMDSINAGAALRRAGHSN
jgi:predicted 2-oxoglutarate/Fe(II)-dependent dioxygenase YbiX